MTAMKLYTKKGDRGQTSLFSGRRAAKCDPRVAAVGDLDELSASLGLARVAYPDANDLLCCAQKALYTIGAIVSAESRQIDIVLADAETEALEAEIDRATDALPPLRDFIYPGEAEASARLHMARAVARRAERSIAALEEPAAPENVLAYLNRLSDLLFALARLADQQSGHADRMLGG
ncbi:cob(I)yrinic acid a,c-diamide adenosyltransferase [Methylocystis sp. B8]|uniref:cob(I)yrinic acid a,c-diamide adenosyltransferase n=1 Tax=Methylocystis sp. B8 TaxID=544938 RepID=UPI001FF0648D|nr:cob(I)yrinic acid a,c-diamide adenosyltransferase [Methylocystis sp. B8]